jgi:hypothetical protein
LNQEHSLHQFLGRESWAGFGTGSLESDFRIGWTSGLNHDLVVVWAARFFRFTAFAGEIEMNIHFSCATRSSTAPIGWVWLALIALSLFLTPDVTRAQDSLGMQQVAELDYWQSIEDIQIVNDLAYVVSGSVLRIIDLSDSTHPVVIGQGRWYDTWWGSKVCVTGNTAYVAAGFGLSIFDVADPTHPLKVNDWDMWDHLCEGELTDVFVAGNNAIVNINGYLVVLNVSDPLNIYEVGAFPGFISPTSPIGMVGSYLCLNGLGLSLWDISDPSLPVKVAECDTLCYSSHAVLSGNHIYRATSDSGIYVIDVSDPLHPSLVTACDTGWCDLIAISGNRVVVSKSPGLQFWPGLHFWNVANPAQPVFEGGYPSETYFRSIACCRTLLCIGDEAQRGPALRIVDIANPSTPTEVGSCGIRGFFRRMAIRGVYGYVAGWGLGVLDLTDSARLVEIGRSQGGSMDMLDVAVRGNQAYLADGSDGLLAYDIQDPAHPESLATLTSNIDCIQRVVMVGDYGYVLDGYAGTPLHLLTFAVDAQGVPVYVDTIRVTNFQGGPYGFAAANGYLYLGEGRWFWIYSLADPAAPQLIGSCELPFLNLGVEVGDLAIMGDYVYVAYESGGLRIVDVSNPSRPTEVGSNPAPTWAVAASGNILAVRETDAICLLDATDRLHPVQVGYHTTDMYESAQLLICGQYLLNGFGSRLQVYRCDALDSEPPQRNDAVSRFALHNCYPNPFNSTTRLEFTLPTTQRVSLRLYDVLGREVAVMLNEIQTAGKHEMMFDASGLASGVYLCRLEAGGMAQTRKMVLVK